ncbi:NAD-dependent epimerase/dehydratase family protein [Phytoactinopolyspora halotolerans]|nr:NAD(P)-dependent oxidoreductase [Phytoactinopolyspora halotolerans]
MGRDGAQVRVLVVGGSGKVGRMVVPVLARHHELRLLDLVPPAEPGHGGFVEGSALDADVVREAAEGQDALIYLAMGRQTDWGTTPDWAKSHFDVNVTGVHLTLRAAAEAGVRQAVYTSSGSVFSEYLAQDHTADPVPDADDVYGLTKRLGEQVCAAAARRHGMSVTALRLVAPVPDDEWPTYDGPHRAGATAASDVARAYLGALERPRPGFHAYIVAGDVERRWIDWSHTERDLGWRPTSRPPQ